jgi:glycosyltransferase involved in cell wall biosynthesis
VRAKIIFANRYFYPDLSATSQMLADLAGRLAQAGFEVHVVCSRELYENPAAKLPVRELVGKVCVHRVWTSGFGRRRLLGRALDYLSFYLSAGARLLTLTRGGDVLVVKTDPPLLSLIGLIAARCRGATLVNWLQDLFPEVAAKLYEPSLPRWAQRWLQSLRDRSLRVAAVNIVIGAGMRDYLLSRGIPAVRVRVIENWASGFPMKPKAACESELRRRLQLQQRFVVAYSGNLGRAHEFETLFDAAVRLQADTVFVFLMIGGGVAMEALRARVTERGLTNFRFLPYRPREALSDSLASADVHLVCLRPELEGLIVPSKIYGILAAARPAVFIGDPEGEVARVLREADCGTSVSCGDGRLLAEELQGLRSDAERAQRMGTRARRLFEESYTLDCAIAKWIHVLEESGLSLSLAHSDAVPSKACR